MDGSVAVGLHWSWSNSVTPYTGVSLIAPSPTINLSTEELMVLANSRMSLAQVLETVPLID
jgi:hypothetical protein